MTTVTIVDDNPVAIVKMRRLLEHAGLGDVRGYSDPNEALQALAAMPPEVLLVDYVMPGMNGVQFLQSLQQSGFVARTPIALVSGHERIESLRIDALRAGAHDVICKSLDPLQFVLRVRNLARLALVSIPARSAAGFQPLRVPTVASAARTETAAAQVTALQQALTRVAQHQRQRSGRHPERVAHYAAAIGHHCGLSLTQQDQLLVAAAWCDIGTLAVPDHLLNTGQALEDDDRSLLESHTVIGHSMLHDASSPLLHLGGEIALSHHEHWDGTGYPFGLSGAAIPLSGRIVAVADAFDELTVETASGSRLSAQRAAGQIAEQARSRFDPVVVEAFMRALPALANMGREVETAKTTGRATAPVTAAA